MIFARATIIAVNLPNVTLDHAVGGVVNGTYQTNTLVFNNSLNTSAVYLRKPFQQLAHSRNLQPREQHVDCA